MLKYYITRICMNFEQFQPSIWCTLDHKITQIWLLANMEYKPSKLWLLCCCFWCRCMIFYPCKCTSLIIFEQVVCPNVLKWRLHTVLKPNPVICKWFKVDSNIKIWNLKSFRDFKSWWCPRLYTFSTSTSQIVYILNHKPRSSLHKED